MMNMRVSLATLLLLACGNGGTTPADAGAGDVKSESSLAVYHLKGQIVDSTTGAGIPYAYVGIGALQGPSDGTGSYDQLWPAGPFSSYAAAPDAGTSYVLTLDQIGELLGDADRGKTPINPLLYEQSIRDALTIPPGTSSAILHVIVIGIGACTDVTGATIAVPNVVAPDAGPNTGNPVLVYFSGNPPMPDESISSVVAGVAPSAIVYNIPTSPDAPLTLFNKITVQHPTCKQAPFPVADPVEPNLQYTGDVYLEASAISGQPLAVSTIRLFLQ